MTTFLDMNGAVRASVNGGVVALPANFAVPGEVVWISKNPRGCLSVMHEAAWNDLAAKLAVVPEPSSSVHQSVCRLLLDSADVQTVSDLRTVVIPEYLMHFAKIHDAAEFIPVGESLILMSGEMAALHRAVSDET